MGNRRFSRELVIQFLYLTEMNEGDVASQLKAFWEDNACDGEVQSFAEDILNDIFEHKKEIDARLEKYSDNWTLSRMTVIDRNLLRLAASELMYSKTVPPRWLLMRPLKLPRNTALKTLPILSTVFWTVS